jgi:hypothetical protein
MNLTDRNILEGIVCLLLSTAEKLTGERPVLTLCDDDGNMASVAGGSRVRWEKIESLEECEA